MTLVEIGLAVLDWLFTNLPLVFLTALVGLGPGFILGIVIANQFFGHGLTYLETHEEAMRQAGAHNAQWNPNHERWNKD